MNEFDLNLALFLYSTVIFLTKCTRNLQGEYLDCHTPICLKLPGAEVGGTVRCPM